VTSKLTNYGWKIGLFIAIVLPLLFLLQSIILLSGAGSQTAIAQVFLSIMQVLPYMAFATGLGVLICLLVKIEACLREQSPRD
jgi:hypothetical protein